jgi:hypothetical protein
MHVYDGLAKIFPYDHVQELYIKLKYNNTLSSLIGMPHRQSI